MKDIILAKFSEATAAHMARVRLDAAGIEAWLDDEHFASVYPFYTGAIGRIKLRVREEDADAALEVLGVDPADAAIGQRQCPKCASKKFRQNNENFFWILLLTLLTMGLYLPLIYRRSQCDDCGHRW